jgi:hypothetical protein
VDLDNAYKRFTPKQITDALANYYYDLIEMPSDTTEQTKMAIDSHNAQMIENRKAFMSWEPTITKWIKKYSDPFFKKKAFLVEIPIVTTNLTDLKAKFAEKIGGGLESFEANLLKECESRGLNQFGVLMIWNDQHQLEIPMGSFYSVQTQTKTKTSIPLKWMIFKRAEGENFPSRFVNVFTETPGVDLELYSKVLLEKHSQFNNNPATPYYGYVIASDIKLNGKYWNIDGFCALWV